MRRKLRSVIVRIRRSHNDLQELTRRGHDASLSPPNTIIWLFTMTEVWPQRACGAPCSALRGWCHLYIDRSNTCKSLSRFCPSYPPKIIKRFACMTIDDCVRGVGVTPPLSSRRHSFVSANIKGGSQNKQRWRRQTDQPQACRDRS